MDILSLFCKASGENINMDKSNIMLSRNTPNGIRKNILVKSRFRETSSLGTYIGVMLTGKSPKYRDFQYLIEKVQEKLAHWK
ncbi:unnamed protein product [Lathyrus sativus]|nr:unnamed protein product [Lathyrus sativus]